MKSEPRLMNVDAKNVDTMPCCGIKSHTHPGLQRKHCWLKANLKFGLRAKVLLGADGKPCGYLEYLPGEYAWRGVDAAGYMFIHCLWIYSKRDQHKGGGSALIEACVRDATEAGMDGVAVVTRKGPWLADRRVYLANGFSPAGTAPPDYELLVRKLNAGAAVPVFKGAWDERVARYGRGLTILQSGQCPYVAKFAAEIAESAEREYAIKPRMVEIKSWRQAQNAPTPYAVFALIYDGRLLADHQISRTRFRNIMRKCLSSGVIKVAKP